MSLFRGSSLLLGILFLLSGCASNSLLGSVSRAAWAQYGSVPDVTLTASLNPAYRYLRVLRTDSGPALWVLGYLEPDPSGEIEVWYSGAREVLKVQNGRIVGSVGLPTDWRQVRYSQIPPAWADVRAEASYTRLRDQMPGYQFGLLEHLMLHASETPPPEVLAPVASQAKGLVWYRESVSSLGSASLPDAWFAVSASDHRTVLYSYQCLSAQMCLHLQAWPPEKGAS